MAIIPSPSVNRLSYFSAVSISSLSRERRVCWTSKRFAFFLSVNWVLFFAGPHRSFFPLQLSFSISLLFFIFTTWRGETFVVVVRCQPLLQQFPFFFLHFVGGLKEFETKRENQRPTVWPFGFVSLSLFLRVFCLSVCT